MPPANSDSPKKKTAAAALDLISDEGGADVLKSRRQRRAEKIAAEEENKGSKIEKQKAAALDLLDEKPKPKRRAASASASATGASAKAAAPASNATAGSTGAPAPVSKQAAPAESRPPLKAASEATAAETEASNEPEEDIDPSKIIVIKPPITVKDLAERLGVKLFELMRDLIGMEIHVSPTQPIEPEIAARLCERRGFVFEREKREKGGGVHKAIEKVEEPEPEPEDLNRQELRAPIITFMGHVDHGKTSLLDRIRATQVTAGEAGGITQHIGAYTVRHEGKPITFLDTPGHSVFSQMRARGANVTDIVVLVVAADDGIMPQTLEALDHAKAAKVTIIVAINKVDKVGANVDRVYSQLMEHGLQPVALGGSTETVLVSAVSGQGIDELLEMMALQSEVLELKANPKANARATVIEARTQAGRGPTASVVVREGTLKSGTPFVCGPFSGKVKSLVDDQGNALKEAPPGTPVEVIGFDELPRVGDELVQMKSERDAKKLADERQEELRKKKLSKPMRSRLESLFADQSGPQKKKLQIILKGDVQGSVEAIVDALEEIKSDKVELQILHGSAGPITENDILLASASDAVVLGFQTKVEPKAIAAAKRESVQIKLYSIVYELLDQVKEAMTGLLDPLTREQIIGHAEVRQVFKVKRGRAAGCVVMDGRVNRNAHARVLRGGQPVFDGKMSTLRRFQDEVNEVKSGTECGIRLGDFDEYEESDVIECYLLEKLKQEL